MTVEEAVVTQLQASSDVTSVVGPRIYQLILPQRPQLPAVRVQLVREGRENHLRGPDSMTRARVQVDCYFASTGDAYDLATNLADHVFESLIYGQWNSTSPNRQIHGVKMLERMTRYEGEEFRLVRVMQDFWVWSAE